MQRRHKRQQQQLKRAPRHKPEVDTTADAQPFSSAVNVKKHSMLHMKAEGGRTKHRLDKFKRGGRTKRFDDGGTVSGPSLDKIRQQMADYASQTAVQHQQHLQGITDIQKQMNDYANRTFEGHPNDTQKQMDDYAHQTFEGHQDDEP
jgi:hypothetical protein